MPLYHSFPRGEDPGGTIGLATLRCFAHLGFVLAPEVIELQERLSSGLGRTMRIGQKRICFTEIEAGELQQHAQTFGPFSIEFDIADLNTAGATPVFYYPPAESLGGMSGVAEALILNLGDIVNLINDLAELKNFCMGRNGPEPVTLEWANQVATTNISHLSAMLAYLEHKNGEFRHLQAAIRGLGQLFYPTHVERYVDPLAYYRQREWRLIGDIAVNGVLTMRAPTNEEIDLLLQANPRFFSREVELLNGPCRRADECRIYVHPEGRHAMSFARRVIVPRDHVNASEAILREAGVNLPVVALEN